MSMSPLNAWPHHSDETAVCIAKALESLSPEDRDLIAGYSQYSPQGLIKTEVINSLAERHGLPPDKFRITIHRIRLKFQRQISECLSGLSTYASTMRRVASLTLVIEEIRKLEPSLISHLQKQSEDLIRLNPLVLALTFNWDAPKP